MTERERYRLKQGGIPVAWSEGPDAQWKGYWQRST